MATTIDTLQIEIESSSSNAAVSVDALAKSLKALKENGKISATVKNLRSFSEALDSFTANSAAISRVESAAKALSSLKGVKVSSTLGNGLLKLRDGIAAVNGVDVTGLKEKLSPIVEALSSLSGLKSGINGMLTGLMKIPDVTKALDDTTIGNFADRVKEVEKSLASLSLKMTPIAEGFRGINTYVKQTNVSLKEAHVNIKVFNLSNVVNVLSRLKASLQRVVNEFMKLIETAEEWDGILARFGRGFGSQSSSVYSWIRKLNTEIRINVQQFMQYSSVYATMLSGYGVAAEDASKMALGYMELTYDIWAGYNDIYQSLDDAATAVRSAIAGEVEPIRKAGFTITEATLKQTAANHGLKVSINNATEAQKSYLRYLALVDQAHTQGLVGTYAKELDTAEGVMRTLSQQTKSLSQALGSLFLPILVKVVPYVQAFVELLQDGVQAVAAFFGVTIQEIDWSGYESGVDGVTGSLDEATEAANQLKNATVGIDELNVISPSSANNGLGAGIDGLGFDSLDVESLWDESILTGINSQVDSLKEKIKEFLSPMGGILEYLWDYRDTIGTIIMMIVGAKVVSVVKKGWGEIQKLKIVSTLVDEFKLLRKNGKSAFTELNRDISIFRLRLSKMQKVAITAVATVLEFTTIKDSMKSIAKGCDDVGAKIATIGIAATAAGAAMYAALGPWGLALAAVVGITAAIVGVAEAQQEWHYELAKTEYYENNGVAIDKVRESLINYFDSMDFDKHADWIDTIKSAEEAYDLAHDSYDEMWDSIASKPVFDKSDIAGLADAFKELADAAKAVNDAKIGSLMQSIKTGIELNITDKLNNKLGGLLDKIREAQKILGQKISSLSSEYQSVLTEISNNGGKATSAQKAKLSQLKSDLTKFTLSNDASTARWNIEIEDALKQGIHAGGNVDAVLANVNDLISDRDNYIESLKQKFAADVNTLEQLINLDKTEFGGQLGFTASDLTTIKKSYEAQISNVYHKYDDVLDELISNYSKNTVMASGKKYEMIYDNKAFDDFVMSVGGTIVGLFDPEYQANSILAREQTELLETLKSLSWYGWSSSSGASRSFATGGFPEEGQMFFAREAGPELVGTIGNRTAVMNNDQIVASVSEGVYHAVIAAQKAANGGEGQSVNVYLDGKQITDAVEQRQRERGASIMGNQVYSYG